MPKNNQEEYEILKETQEEGYKWIARNYNGALIIYTSKPMKNPNLYWDGFGKRMDDRLFKFIQWEDEEPYNIQELIEEYLYDNQPKLFIDGQEQSFEFIEESEEKEVKKLKSVITEFSQESQVVNSWEGSFTGGYLSSIGFAEVEISSESPLDRGEYLGKEVTIIVGDDEPEVLSQEWIDEHKENWQDLSVTGYSVPEKDLQNLLVPKQELPVIPKFVAEVIVEHKELGYDVYDSIDLIIETNGGGLPSISNWVARNIDKYARAWLDGYEVEEEKKYYVLDKENATLLKKSAVGEEIAKSVGTNIYNAKSWKNEEEYQLTEQEIKDYDERFWPFAVKVEEDIK